MQLIIDTIVKGTDQLRGVTDGVNEVKKASAALKPVLLGALGAIGAVALKAANDMDQANARIRSGLKGTEAEMKAFGSAARDVWAAGFGDSLEDTADAVTVVVQQMRKLGSVTQEELEKNTQQAIAFSTRFESDIPTAMGAASTLVKQFGLSWDQAWDFIASGQQEGLNSAGDFLETITEYSTQFKDAGLSAAEFYSAMKTGGAEGVLGVDKVADSIKEAKLKLSEMGKETVAALDEIGINYQQMASDMESGNLTIGQAITQVIAKLNGVESVTKRTAMGAAILGTQWEDMGTAAASGISFAAVSMKDLEGASASITAQYDTMQAKMELVWRTIQNGVMSVLDGINAFINLLLKTDAATITLVTTMTAGSALFVAWKAGLGTVVIGLADFIKSLWASVAAARAAQVQLLATSGILSAMAAAGFAIVVTFTVIKVAEAVNAFRDMKAAQKEAEQGWREYQSEMEETLVLYQDFANAPKLPADLSKASQEDLRDLQTELQNSKLYWTALHNSMFEKADETNMFGELTDDAKAAREQMAHAKTKIEEINQSLAKIDASGLKKPVEAANASAAAVGEFEQAAKKAYEEAQKAAEKYANEVIKWEEKIKYARMSTEDKLFELSLKGVSEEEAWAAKKLAAEEKLAAAKAALKEKDYQLAEKLAQDAERLYADLATETKDADGNVSQTIDQTKKVAQAGVEAVGGVIEEVYTQQKNAAADMQAEYQTQADTIKKDLDAIAEAREAEVSITVPNLDEMKKRLDALSKDETKTITVKTVEAHSGGGIVGYASGGFVRRSGRLPGFGRRDVVPAYLTWGERILNAVSTRAWDQYVPGFMELANRVRSASDITRLLERFAAGARAYASGGVVMPRISLPAIPRFAEGGTVSGGLAAKNLGSLTLNTGNKTGMIYGDADLLKSLKEAVARENMMGANR